MDHATLTDWMQSVQHAFAELPDPRGPQRLHPLINVVSIALIAVIAGAEDCTDFESFGRARQGWLSGFLDLSQGIPSHDTFSRVFALLDPIHWQSCFVDWVRHTLGGCLDTGDVIALDGKCLRGAQRAAQPIYLVNAWSSQRGLCLAQQSVEDKSNEITALPGLLETLGLLKLEGCTVTVDAMGTQREVARLTLEQGADYLMALKDNQPSLAEDVRWLFEQHWQDPHINWGEAYNQQQHSGHGRLETRRCWVISDVTYLQNHAWPGLRAVVCIERQRQMANATLSTERSFYLASAVHGAQHTLDQSRAHWGVENNLHWQLDVLFKEDRHRAWVGQGPINLSVLRQLALNLLNTTPAPPGVRTLKAKRKHAAWDVAFLELVLAHL